MVWFQAESDSGRSRWLWGNPLRLVTNKIRAIHEYLETPPKYSILVQLEAGSRERLAILPNKVTCGRSPRYTGCGISLRKRYAWRPRISLIKGKAWFWDRVLFLKLIRNVVYKICLSKKQDHLGNRNKMRNGTEKPEATLSDYRVPGISLSTVKQQDVRRQNNVTKLIEMFEKHQHEEQFLKDSSQTQKINRFSEESPQLFANMNYTEIFELYVLIEIPCGKSGWFVVVAEETGSIREVLQPPRRTIATVLRSLALSLRRIPVENQNTVSLKDR